MNYHNITPVDMLNGDGLRTVLWVSGCEMHCQNCHNPETWDVNSGIPFDEDACRELFTYLDKDYIDGLTLSGGHPLHEKNVKTILLLVDHIKKARPNKTIWLYTGYDYSDIVLRMLHQWAGDIDTLRYYILQAVDVICDGPFIQSQADVSAHWVGSRNQRVIDAQATRKNVDRFIRETMISQHTAVMNDITVTKEDIDKLIVLHK